MQLITQKNIKLQNMMKVFQEIYRQGSVSRQVLSAKTDISLMTVGKIVDQLLRYDLAYEEKEDTSKVGRKGNVVSLAPDHRTIVLLDLERHNFKLGILQMDLKIKGELYQHTYDYQKSYEDNLRNAVTHFLHNWLSDSLDGVIGVGVCVPGPYYEKGDRVLDSRIPELSTAKLKQTLSPLFPGQILYIDEDVKCSVRFDGGLALQADNIFYAIIGEGVGSAIFYDGRVLGSAYSYAGEIGQMYTKKRQDDRGSGWHWRASQAVHRAGRFCPFLPGGGSAIQERSPFDRLYRAGHSGARAPVCQRYLAT